MPQTDHQQELHDLLARSIGPGCHELRGPLAAAFGFAKMLEGNDSLDEAARRYVGQVVHGCERLDVMLDSLARMGRVAAGRVHPERDHVPVAEALRAAVEGTRHESALTISGSIGDDVVALADDTWFTESIAGVLDALRYDDAITATAGWTHTAADVTLEIRTHGDLPSVDTSVGEASLSLACARMRVVAMGGTVDPAPGGGVDITLPRP